MKRFLLTSFAVVFILANCHAQTPIEGILTHTSNYFKMYPYSSIYDDGSHAKIFYDGNNKKILFWNSDSSIPHTSLVTGSIESNGTMGISSATPVFRFKENDIVDKNFQIDVSGGNFNIRTNNNNFDNASIKFSILNNGNVGIGTASPDSELSVNGIIHTKEVKVDLNGWSDFVFDPDYELKSLEEVDKFIAENKHLPEIPTEAEVEENGINLGEMDAKLLQKIEELTLYLIEQNKKLEAQNAKIEQLQNELLEMKRK